MADNLAEFERQIEKATEDLTETQLVAFHQKIALEALGRIVDKTPVDSGRARGNWQLTIGAASRRILDVEDAGGGNTKVAGATQIAALQPFQVVWISNNLPYILVLEHGGFVPPDPGPSKDPRKYRFGRVLVQGGYSVQAPQGMVSVTVSELLAIFP